MNRNSRFGKAFFVILCLVLAVLLVGFLWHYRQEESRRTEELAQEAKEQAASEEVDLNSSSGFSTRTMENPGTSSESAASESVSAQSASASSSSDQSGQNENVVHFDTISVRGDGFYRYGTDVTNSSIAYFLQQDLQNAGSSQQVRNFTLDMAGTLSQMRKAGIPEDTLNGYVTAHRNAANGRTLQDTETIIRDQSAEETARDDQGSLPVIGMGYFGGFNDDVNELIAQEEAVLDTYSQQDNYIIYGYYPERFTTEEQHTAYNDAMTARWGEHYVPLYDIVNANSLTVDSTRQAIAQAIFDKMQELGYVG